MIGAMRLRTGDRAPGWWTLVAGLILAIGALIAAPIAGAGISSIVDDAEGRITWSTLFVGVFFTGCFFWWLVIGRSQTPTIWRGAITGILVGLFSYPVVLALSEIFRRGAGVTPDSLGDRAQTVGELTAFTVATTGFAATLALAAVGAIASLVLRPVYPRPMPRARGHRVKRTLRALGGVAVIIVALLTGIFIWLSLLPLDAAGISGAGREPPHAVAMTYPVAVARYETIRKNEAELPLNPRCGSILLTHGARVAEAVVYLHGLTNCPAQADELSAKLFDLGYNVYVPRLPGHGEADQMTMALRDIRAEDYVSATEQAIELARGLGDKVIVTGLSGGGALTMWAAQYRADVSGTVALASFLGPNMVPSWANRAATNFLRLIPNIMFTWNPLEPLGPPEMDYAYPRVPTRALAQFMRIGEIVGDGARLAAPSAGGLGLVINEADFAVNNQLVRDIAESWRAHGRAVDIKVLPISLRLLHDLIDPRQIGANIEFVYPMLVDMIRHSDPP